MDLQRLHLETLGLLAYYLLGLFCLLSLNLAWIVYPQPALMWPKTTGKGRWWKCNNAWHFRSRALLFLRISEHLSPYISNPYNIKDSHSLPISVSVSYLILSIPRQPHLKDCIPMTTVRLQSYLHLDGQNSSVHQQTCSIGGLACAISTKSRVWKDK